MEHLTMVELLAVVTVGFVCAVVLGQCLVAMWKYGSNSWCRRAMQKSLRVSWRCWKCGESGIAHDAMCDCGARSDGSKGVYGTPDYIPAESEGDGSEE